MSDCHWTKRVIESSDEVAPPEVRAHLRACEECRRLAMATDALRLERRTAESIARARLPSAEAMRVRIASAELAAVMDPRLHPRRDPLWPIRWVERIALGAALLIAAAVAGTLSFVAVTYVPVALVKSLPLGLPSVAVGGIEAPLLVLVFAVVAVATLYGASALLGGGSASRGAWG